MIQALPSLTLPAVSVEILRARCSTCSMHQLCLPMGLDMGDMDKLDQIIGRRRKVTRGSTLFRIGDPFANLYAIRLGHFKTYQINPGGEEQVTGFQMAGELLGMDAISADRHHCNAVALEDSEVCEIPFASLEQLLAEMPTLLRHFHRMMSQEITREQSVMLLLGNMQATQRFAAFIVNLASRYEARGYSGLKFQLRMSREEIGNYLGLTIESISRLLSKFKKEGLLKVSNREIEIVDPGLLKAITAGTATCG
ncbi:fumarate/nitrate reduction transcriptional regulator Fnr [Janthinobacterium agaricidamnosum]|uniref:Cyclic nucleotide-binding domain protein n=1 Tax=Janthinobacterium agaricidamnosum NBRC 102515 = DSM 9628 TaxID=1349767 RepID=W0VF98_9BURK|nr:fumarate/nitrate reduction transcriptional regulator Fnr [Janthinobacterium agaricidamnosum]CDG86027.1 cyclic nucleotide-binding domain protein [Janthinobacterium agaricidamnosum NBRC 102515 = DSM 9628]